MSIFGVMITYACCWWLVLFMVLPWKVQVPEKPASGHAASAPLNPAVRRKLLLTTLLAVIPTAVLYVLIGTAQAADMYHAGGSGDCEPLTQHQPDADILTTDGTGARGKAVAPATMDNGQPAITVGDVYLGVEMPAADYVGAGQHPALGTSKIYAGAVRVSPDGSVAYNGQPIANQPVLGKGCK